MENQQQEFSFEPVMEHKYAGFWIRFIASLIDGILLTAVTYLLGFRSSTDLFSFSELFQNLLGLVYFIILTVLYGQTLGKMICGIKVVRTDEKPNSWGSIILRETIGKLVSGIVLLLGFIWAAFDKRKQGWHDKMANTYVVKTRK
jgi:uncharacterized RDD family membrane protein YckC